MNAPSMSVSSPLLNTVDTVNAAAAAIVTAEARVQPDTVQKKRWGSCWSLHRCFGFHRNNKRIGHAILIPEPTTTALGPALSSSNQPPSSSGLFIAPPSSPASFLQSDSPSTSESRTKLLSLASLADQAQSRRDSETIFAIGPYAYETQLVSPPVFSTFTTEPSTAAFTPPPEPSTAAFTTTPPSPDVPLFAQLLASSLERARRNGGTNPKFTLLSQGEFQPYQSAQVISPGSSASGASTPFPPRTDHFPTSKWGSRVGSGTLTPDGVGLRSRLGSGGLTPHQESLTIDDPIAKVLSVFNSDNGSKHIESEPVMDHHRVSFELTGEDVARCLESKSSSSFREFPEDFVDERYIAGIDRNRCEFCLKESTDRKPGSEICCQKQHLVKFGSGKEFKFDSATSNVDLSRTGSSWSFFPLLQPEIS